MSPPDRVCASCGRTFSWRKAWARDWAAVRYCSKRCRQHRPGRLDRELESAVLTLLGQRPRGATITPAEAAQQARPADWSAHIERTRRAARRLTASGMVELLQKGRQVDPSTARGPIQIRLVQS